MHFFLVGHITNERIPIEKQKTNTVKKTINLISLLIKADFFILLEGNLL